MMRSVVVVALLTACQKPMTTIPQDFAGSYTHTTTTQLGGLLQQQNIEELTVTTAGMSVKSSDPMKMGGDIQMGAGSPLSLSMGSGAATSDLFTEVTCSGAVNCRFKTKQRCEGSISKNPDGSLTVIATQACTEWSGSWIKASLGSGPIQ